MRSERILLGSLIGLLLLSLPPLRAQIAQPGTQPAGVGAGGATRSSLRLPVLRLGAFDRDSALLAMERMDEDPLRLYLFAHKQETDIDLIREAYHTTLRDGREVWQYRVTSPGALSLSFFFEDVHLPEGALLFVYDETQTHLLGGFGPENVSRTSTLGVMPLEGDDLILEIQSPAGTRPSLHLTEVNHGLRSFTRADFGTNFGYKSAQLACTPEVVCVPDLDLIKRAVVAVVINGVGIGTGTMVTTTAGASEPYLLTAAHVLSQNFTHDDLERQAERTMAVFNYDSPSCSGEVMPDLSQSVSGAELIGFDKPTDACLLRLSQAPPESYRPYYLGWSAEEHPEGSYINIHHPHLMTKRVNYLTKELKTNTTFYTNGSFFDEHMHYEVSAWDVGTTAAGSSGSPLLDRNRRVVGGLSGGSSYCDVKAADYFFSLANVWAQGRESTEAIVHALDPKGTGTRTTDGQDPYATPRSTAYRITHVANVYSGDSLSLAGAQLDPQTLLGGTDAVGEYYSVRPGTRLYGAYLMLDMSRVIPEEVGPQETTTLEVYLGDGSDTPAGSYTIDLTRVMKETLPSEHDKLHYRELFVPFDQPITVEEDGTFILAVPTADLPKGVSILHRQYKGAGGQMMTKSGAKWAPRTLTDGTIALWIDPLLSDPEGANTQGEEPLFTLISASPDRMMIRIAERVTEPTDFEIYTIDGQRLYSRSVRYGYFLLPRRMLEGLGILVLHMDTGAEQLTLKALFPTL